MNANDPRRERLANDHAGLVKLARESGGTVEVLEAEGTPPTRHRVRLRCRGPFAPCQVVEAHTIEIVAGAEYPLRPPEARFVTPIFNPHVHPDGRICLGTKTGLSERLEDLVVRIGGLIQYDPALIDPKSPANWTALAYFQAIRTTLPFGRETFRRERERPAPAAPALVWKERR